MKLLSSEAPEKKKAGQGAVMLEFIVAFPLILMLMLAAVQLAHLWLARVVVHYAAYCAARTAIVSEFPGEYGAAPQAAAEQVLAWVHVGDNSGVSVPGWGNIPGSGGVGNDTRVTVTDTGNWNVRAKVEYDFSLITPIIGPLMANAAAAQLNLIPTETGDWGIPFPKLTLTETVYLSKPYRCVMPAEWP